MSLKKCVVTVRSALPPSPAHAQRMPTGVCDLTSASMHSRWNGLKTTRRKSTCESAIICSPSRTFVVRAAIAVQDHALGRVENVPETDAVAHAGDDLRGSARVGGFQRRRALLPYLLLIAMARMSAAGLPRSRGRTLIVSLSRATTNMAAGDAQRLSVGRMECAMNASGASVRRSSVGKSERKRESRCGARCLA